MTDRTVTWGGLAIALLVVSYCYQAAADRAEPIAASPVSVPPPAPEPAPPSWVRAQEQSPMDDSTTVFYSRPAEREIAGWLKTHRPLLVVRCMEGRTDAFIETGMSSSVEYGGIDKHTVQVRFDEDPASTQRWNDSTDDSALFSPAPIPFARRLARAKRLRFGFTPFKASPVVAEFAVDGFAAPADELAEACRWGRTKSR